MIVGRKISVQAATALLAAFAAVVLLAAVPSGAAALSWSLPATDLSAPGGSAYNPQVAVAVDGATTVVWSRWVGPNLIVQASTRAAGGTFSAVVNLSAPGQSATNPQVAVAVDGATTVVWVRSDGFNSIVQASTRPAGGTFPVPADVVNLSAPLQDAFGPQVAVAVDGATTVVWQRWTSADNMIQASTRPAGSGSTFGPVVDLSAEGQRPYEPQVAVGGDGATTIVWYLWNGVDNIVQARTRAAGSGTFGGAVDLSAEGQNAYDPQVAVAVDGATTVVWSRSDGASDIVQASTRAAGGTFPVPADVVNLSAPLQNADVPQVAVAVDGATTVVWTRGDDDNNFIIQESTSGATPYSLTLTRSGVGSGSVSSSPAGIDCGLVCSYPFSLSTSVTLTASPAAGSSFTGWSGAGCSGTSTCTVTMLGARAVNAEFAVVPPGSFNLAVSKSGTGSGTVTSLTAGINCGADCSETLVEGTSVTLTAAPAGGSTFTAWSGSGCSGTSTCTVVMSAARAVTAQFTANAPPPKPSNVFPTPTVKAGASALVSSVRVPGPGTLTQRVTRGRLTAAVLTVCKTSRKATKAGTVKLTCKLNAATRAALRQRSLRVSVKTTFTPTGGLAASKTQAVTLKSQRPPPYTG